MDDASEASWLSDLVKNSLLDHYFSVNAFYHFYHLISDVEGNGGLQLVPTQSPWDVARRWWRVTFAWDSKCLWELAPTFVFGDFWKVHQAAQNECLFLPFFSNLQDSSVFRQLLRFCCLKPKSDQEQRCFSFSFTTTNPKTFIRKPQLSNWKPQRPKKLQVPILRSGSHHRREKTKREAQPELNRSSSSYSWLKEGTIHCKLVVINV